MTTSPRYNDRNGRTGMSFHDLDDMQPAQHRFSSVTLRSADQIYQHQKTRNNDGSDTSKSERSGFCSKKCLIGLAIGLAIGVVLVIAIAVPIGVTKKCSVGITSSTPNWIGTFQMDNACDTSACCCLSSQITLSQTSNNQMQIVGNVTGLCAAFSSPITLIQSMPTGFQAIVTWSLDRIRLQLSRDNSYISFVNINYPMCSASASRTSKNGGSMKRMDLGLAMFILLITIGIIRCE